MSISVSCSSCHTSLKVRDDLAGKRGKCPKCGTAIEIPAAASSYATTPAPVAAHPAPQPATKSMSSDEALTELRRALEALPAASKTMGSKGGGGFAAMYCSLTRWFQYALPVVLAGLLGYYYVAYAETMMPLITYIVLGVGGLLTLMAALSLVGASPAKPSAGLPMDARQAPLLADAANEIAKTLQTTPPKLVAVWDETLRHHRQTIYVGMASLGNLPLSDAIGLLSREIAVESGKNYRAIEAEYRRLQALIDPPQGEKITLVTKLVRMLGLLGRPLNWILFSLVRLVSEGSLHNTELAADMLQAHLVGSQGFTTVFKRQRLVSYAVEMVLADLPFQSQENALADNRPKVVEQNIKDMPAEVKQSILETSPDDPRTSDFVPDWQERMEAITKANLPATLHLSASAKLLLGDYDALCRETTWIDCEQRFGERVRRRDLKPT